MIKWFVYIFLLLVSTPCLLLAKAPLGRTGHVVAMHYNVAITIPALSELSDTTKNAKATAKADAKVKEVPKKKTQPKPEKVDDNKEKPKRERRPDGMQRPPEIPRRNDN